MLTLDSPLIGEYSRGVDTRLGGAFRLSWQSSQLNTVAGEEPLLMVGRVKRSRCVSTAQQDHRKGLFAMSKVCSKCGRELDTERFHKNKTKKDGLADSCKDCAQAYQRAYCIVNREKLAACQRAHRAEHVEEVAAYQRAYRAEHREELAVYRRAYHVEHREKIVAYKRAYYIVNREEESAKHRVYHTEHREEWAARNRAYDQAHPDERLQRKAMRRARLHNSPTEKFSRADIFARDLGRCHLCGKKVDPQSWHLDHLVPISLGGSHTRSNTAVSHPLCNIRRNATGPAQLRLWGGI
jgi:5-methylcytosine-specific restriction endonuclease McrA